MSFKYIRLASDLHLEAFTGRTSAELTSGFVPADERDAESVLVLAGDISSKLDQLTDFIKALEDRFVRVVFVPGNHELYRHEYHEWNDWLNTTFQEQLDNTEYVDMVSVKSFTIDDVRFIIGTLWGDGGNSPNNVFEVDHALNDFRIIRNYAERFKCIDMIAIHKAQKKQIHDYLLEPFDGKTVVVTHHLPSRRLVSERFWPNDGSDGINGGFVGDCDNILAYDFAPNLWIHGHTHDRISTKLWKTFIECNPAGYRSEWNTPVNTFRKELVFIDINDV